MGKGSRSHRVGDEEGNRETDARDEAHHANVLRTHTKGGREAHRARDLVARVHAKGLAWHTQGGRARGELMAVRSETSV